LWYTPPVRKSLILIPLVVFFIQSCIPANLPAVETGPAATGTQGSPVASLNTSTPILAPDTPSINATRVRPSATPTLTACMNAGRRVEVGVLTTDLLPDPMAYRIYLPPCYDEETDRYYPVLYLVHGKNASDMQWDYLGVPEILDRLVARSELAPFLVVMPRDRVWSEPTADNFGVAVVQSLVPWVDEHFRTLPEREHRAIGGLSRGSAWAFHIGFSHPELFSAVDLNSGVVFSTDVATLYQWLNNFPEGMMPRIYMDIGDGDRTEIVMEAEWVESQLTKYGIPHEWHLYEGGHNDAYWRAHVEEYLRWYGQDWGRATALNNR
jgi:enterochelin esterase-like enzyme